MKKFLLVIVVLIITGQDQQFPQGMPASIKNAGHIYGKITDSDGKPVEGAHNMLHENRDSVRRK